MQMEDNNWTLNAAHAKQLYKSSKVKSWLWKALWEVLYSTIKEKKVMALNPMTYGGSDQQ